MRVWVIYSDAGMGRIGVHTAATDDQLRNAIARAGDELRTRYGLHGQFTKVESPEPYYRDDERVFRCAWLTVVARPFNLEVPDEQT